ncbi:MAG: hypothetical protein WBG90_05070 [Saonia sp.]
MVQDYSITESIPVADHVYKFLIKRTGSDTYIAARTDIIGNIVLSSLGKHHDIGFNKNRFTKLFHVVIKEDKYLKCGVSLGVKCGQVFNRMIDQLFRDELYHHIQINAIREKEKCLKGIRNFLAIYDITEDDIKMETIYRDFKRKKARIESRING